MLSLIQRDVLVSAEEGPIPARRPISKARSFLDSTFCKASTARARPSASRRVRLESRPAASKHSAKASL